MWSPMYQAAFCEAQRSFANLHSAFVSIVARDGFITLEEAREALRSEEADMVRRVAGRVGEIRQKRAKKSDSGNAAERK